uniref:F-box domain-containing protein n=1 Tax=Leersia perrieri TaxID=77586 RepID=A0A0D9XI91_9ORYZ
MSPPRRGRADDAAAQCHHNGCLSVTSRSRGCAKKERSWSAALEDDVLGAILASGLLTSADAVRCAATCRWWRRVVATRSDYISRGLPPLGRYMPHLAVGVFTAPVGTSSRRMPQFIPTTAGARRLGDLRRRMSLVDGIGHDVALLDHAHPVASRNGRLVLQLHRPRTNGLALCVCNPMTGELAMVPPLPTAGNNNKKGACFPYGCALLTADDFDQAPLQSSTFFRLILLYNNNHTTVLRCYSSSDGSWGQEVNITAVATISRQKMRQIGPAVVRRGASAFWALDHGALGVRVRLHLEAMDVHLLPYCSSPDRWPEGCLLGVSPDNRLFMVTFVMWRGFLSGSIAYFDIDGDDISTGRENSNPSADVLYPMFDMKMRRWDDMAWLATLNLRWFCEKSGLVLFTLGDSSGYPGTFALDVRSPAVEKVLNADGYLVSSRNVHLDSPAVVKVADGHSWSCFVGYEMDMATYLSTLAA